jgi:uncharacterized membrane protein
MTLSEKSSTGLDANIAAALCYVQPIGILFLFLEQGSNFVRFHAMQSTFLLVASIAVWIAFSILTGFLAFVPILGWLVSAVLWLVLALGFFVLWILVLFKAFQGERYKLPYLGDMAEQQLNKS